MCYVSSAVLGIRDAMLDMMDLNSAFSRSHWGEKKQEMIEACSKFYDELNRTHQDDAVQPRAMGRAVMTP